MTGPPATWPTRAALVAVLASAVTAAGAAAADANAPATEAGIARLLTAARAARTAELAEPMLAKAETAFTRLARPADTSGTIDRAFLKADVARARGSVAAAGWKRDDSRDDLRQSGRKALLSALEQYVGLVVRCEELLDKLESRIGQKDPSKVPQWKHLRGCVSRANYSEGWCQYHLAVLAEDAKQRNDRLGRGAERFAGFTAKGYGRHPIVADCFLGQALCQFELGQYFQVLELLKPARADNTEADLFKRMTYLRIEAGQAYGSHLAAESAAKAYFDSLPAGHRLDEVELSMAVARAKCLAALADPAKNPDYHKLFRRRLDAVGRTLYDAGPPWRASLAKILGESSGDSALQCLARARALLAEKNSAGSAAEAERGLGLAGKDGDPSVSADLRYALAAAALGAGDNARACRAARDFIRHSPAGSRHAEMARVAVQAGLAAMTAKPPVTAAEMLELLALVERRVPESPQARHAAWHRAKVLLAAGRYAEVAAALEGVGPSSPVYAEAQYGLAVAAVKQVEQLASAPGADANSQEALLDLASAAVGRFVSAKGSERGVEDGEKTSERVAKVALAVAQRYLELPAGRSEGAIRVLNSAAKLLPEGTAGARRGMALRAWAQFAGGKTDAGRTLEALLAPGGDASDTADVLAALVGFLSARFDRLSGQEAKAARAAGEQLVRVWEVLLADVAKVPPSRRQAREAAVRLPLAQTLLRLGRFAEARPHFGWLVERLPAARAGQAIRGLALCEELAGRPDLAGERWAVLARGLEKSTSPWYEARYHWVWCILRQGRKDDARRMLAYFRLQHPAIVDENWRAKFDELARQLGLEPAATAPGTTRPAGARTRPAKGQEVGSE